MPFRRERYPDDWEEISLTFGRGRVASASVKASVAYTAHIQARRCEEQNGRLARWANGKVALTVAHLNHDTTDNRPENLKAMCQRCHLRYDAKHHARSAAETRRRRRIDAGQITMEIE